MSVRLLIIKVTETQHTSAHCHATGDHADLCIKLGCSAYGRKECCGIVIAQSNCSQISCNQRLR